MLRETERERRLSPAECQVLDLLTGGVRLHAIAVALNVGYGTIRYRVDSSKTKLGVETLAELGAAYEVWRRGSSEAGGEPGGAAANSEKNISFSRSAWTHPPADGV